MTDSLGFRKKFGIIAPSTNTVVQPEFDALRPRGVTNQLGRIFVHDRLLKSDDDFIKFMDEVGAGLMDAVDLIMTCEPDCLILGMSAATFWNGLEGGKQLQERLQRRAGVGVALGSDACQAALRKFGGIKRIGVITPYMPVADEQVRKFFSDCGYEVVALKALKCESVLRAAHFTESELRDTIDQLNDPNVQAIVQVGSNLAAARVAAFAEFWLDVPVIAINTATYWWALRQNGIDDKVFGFGSLLGDF